jgi:hypothetical protein
MSLKHILETIEAQSCEDTARIIRESEEKAQAIKERARKEAESEAAAYLEEDERKANMEAGRILTQARLDKRLHVLGRKKEIIDGIIAEAFKQKGLKGQVLKKTVVLKDRQKQEFLDENRLQEELRPELERIIVSELKI